MRSKGIQRRIPVMCMDGKRTKIETFTFDTDYQADCAVDCGAWRETRTKMNPSGFVLDFFPNDDNKLTYSNGKNCRSFFPYVGIKPSSRRKNPRDHYNFCFSAFVNTDNKRKCKLSDYVEKPKIIQTVIPFEPITQKSESVQQLSNAQITLDTIRSMMNILNCSQNQAFKMLEVLEEG